MIEVRVMGHVVLLGDSIFDNGWYVPDQLPVIEQLRQALPCDWHATLLAVDGHVTKDVANQMKDLPAGATHLVVSVGGNDALRESSILSAPVRSIGEALGLVHEVQGRFRDTYRAMIRVLGAHSLPSAVCTIYDSIPGLGPAEKTALAGFNEAILREAFAAGLPVIELRVVCDQPSDYSHVSPIEPSAEGGEKIARVIAEVVTTHDFGRRRSMIYK